jgi:hypothetical protein
MSIRMQVFSLLLLIYIITTTTTTIRYCEVGI